MGRRGGPGPGNGRGAAATVAGGLVVLVAVAVAPMTTGATDRAGGPSSTTSFEVATTDDPDPGSGDLGLLPVPDPLPPGAPGDVIASRPFSAEYFPFAVEAHQLVYLSTDRFGGAVPVSGYVLTPVGVPAPVEGRAAVAWAHGTSGMIDGCAPSRYGANASTDITDLLAAGHVVVATDYPGMGTPGLHPYLDGVSEGRAVLDSLRAAQSFGATSRSAVAGFSQGGQAAIFTGTEWASYAPDLDLRAVVPIAAPTFMSAAYAAASAVPAAASYADLILAGVVAARPDLDRSELMTPSGIAALDALAAADRPDGECTNPSFDLAADIRADPLTLPDWRSALVESEPGAHAVPVPVLMVASEGDTTSFLAMTEAICGDLQAEGTDLRLWLYDDEEHGDTEFVSQADRTRWLLDRLDAAPITDAVEFTREAPQVITECAVTLPEAPLPPGAPPAASPPATPAQPLPAEARFTG